MRALYRRIADWAVPAGGDADSRRKARLTVAFALALSPWAFFYSAIYYYLLGVPLGSAGLFLSGVLGFATPWVLRRTGSSSLSGNYLTAVLFLVVLLCGASIGERSSAAVAWLTAVPLLAVLLVDRRSGVLWAVAAGAAVTLFTVLRALGRLPPSPFSARTESLLHGIGSVGLVALFLSFALLYEKRKEEALAQLREEQERTAALHRQLIEASRAAGMAEVAVGVLHNVGNVLNSAQVSAQLLAAHASGVDASSLEKAAEVLDEDGDLAGRRGRLGEYLRAFARKIRGQRGQLVDEAQALCRHVERITEVVAAHRDLAQRQMVVEEVDLAEEIGHTLNLFRAGLREDGITLAEEYPSLPPLRVDRSRLARILSSLVENARSALQGTAARRLTVRAQRSGDHVHVEVADNGVGIAPADADKIFNLGFSTWPGHSGFGLHFSANAAREMGGQLVFRRAGSDGGAVFSLSLPLAA